MATVITGWAKDKNGNKFAPKTLASQVVNADGISIESKLNEMLAAKADAEHNHEISDIENLQSTLNSKASQTALDTLSETINGKANTSALTSHTGDTEIHVTQAEKNTWSGKANATHSHAVTDITGLNASVTELNYMDGVKSNVQAQIDTLESNKVSTSTLTTNYYTKTDVDSLNLITVDDIDSICGTTIAMASEVSF